MTADFSFFAGLNEEQRAAASVEYNAAVGAGAGSGKTRSLAARYLWLITRGCKVEEILTITFMNKAANEMYSRIYQLLAENAVRDPRAALALEQFHRANIHTLDSFCAAVARTASRRFGVSPDFKSDNEGVRELARQTALRFVLDKRDNPALQRLIAEKKIRTVAEELFAEPLLRYGSLSRALDFEDFKNRQRAELLRRWEQLTGEADRHIRVLRESLDRGEPKNKFYENLLEVFKKPAPPPGMESLFDPEDPVGDPGESSPETAGSPPPEKDRLRQQFAAYFEFLRSICRIRMTSSAKEEHRAVKEARAALKDELYPRLEAAANTALQWDIVEAVYPLMAEFQELFNNKKRESGILSFADIARLALDALSRFPDIRRVYKESIKKIMIDEFQDNNSLQRDLIFFLAEKPERDSPELPEPGELVPGKVFFVGDEKQSIFRFRGADVSVFRRLTRDLGGGLSLSRNYRSHPGLVRAFNRIFGGLRSKDDPAPSPGIFPPPEKERAPYEASYSWTESPEPEGGPGQGPGGERLHFALLDEDQIGEGNFPGPEELEAAFIACKIRDMIKRGAAVYDKQRKENRPCTYGDFAVLQRSYSRQYVLEKQLKLFGIPFNANRPSGLFNEAPVNDLRALLTLVVYPEDRIAYGALLRSPFVRLSDDAFGLCMLAAEAPPSGPRTPQGPGAPFDERTGELLPPGDRERYREAGERFRAIREDARNLTAAELLTRLWYDEGYRYETVWSASSQVYGDLYDLLFELARHIDERGGGLCDFIDYLDRLANKREKNDGPDQNGEGPGVRIMSIHKCKGLEFPVVFLFGCSKIERTGGASLTSYSEKWGLALDLPQAEELPLKGGNYFSLLEKEEERRKEEAELRRLLYVAMTRAESELYLTAVLKKQPEGKEKTEGPAFGGYGEAYLRERLVRLNAEDEKSGASKQKPGSLSFLRLLLPVLAGTEEPPYTIEPIPALDRNALRGLAGTGGKETAQSPLGEKTMEEAAAAAAPFYETTAPPPRPMPLPLTIPASGLHVPRLEAAGPPAEFPGPARNAPEGLEGLLKKAGLEAAEFGTLVHGFIEDRFSGREERIPPRFSARCGESLLGPLREQARAMADAFFASPLGRLALAASFRKTEYPILSAVELPAGALEGRAAGGPRRVIISGKLDLLFEGGGALHVVDFKSDRTEEISRHLGQLAVYRRAVSDIFGSPLSGREEGPPVRCWLYYLRSGRERELSGELDLISPEELAAGFTGN